MGAVAAAGLPEIAAVVNAVIAAQFGHNLFATATLAHPDLRCVLAHQADHLQGDASI